jgi:hypothetical protein
MVRLVYTGQSADRSKRDAIWFGDKILQAPGVTRCPMESKQTGAGIDLAAARRYFYPRRQESARAEAGRVSASGSTRTEPSVLPT